LFGLALDFFWAKIFYNQQVGMLDGGLLFEQLNKIVESLLELE
jgi:hypothetical protein